MRDKHQKLNTFFTAKNRKYTVSLALAIAMGLPIVAQANESEEVKKLQQ